MSESKAEETKWRVGSAWQCTVALVIFEFVISLGIRVAQVTPSTAQWVRGHEYSIQTCLKLLRALAWLALAYGFSRSRSARSFALRAGITDGPTLLGWCSAWVGVAIGLAALYAAHTGLTPRDRVVHGFYNQGGELLLFFVVFAILVSPFFEEVVLRGFLYSAFRGSYGRTLSTFIVLSVTSYFHWSTISGSLYSALCLTSLWIMLCLLRERAGTVWNCVLAHAAYNAAQTVTWPTYIAAMILVLPFCLYGSKKATTQLRQPQLNCEGQNSASHKQEQKGVAQQAS